MKKEQNEEEAYRDVSELLGHSRPQIISAYFGPLSNQGKKNIEKAKRIEAERLARKEKSHKKGKNKK